MHSTGKVKIFQVVCHRLVGRVSEDIRYRSAGTDVGWSWCFYKDTVPLERCERKRPVGTISLVCRAWHYTNR